MEYKRVVELFPHDKEELYLLYIDGDVIETTEEHPFWNETSKQWIPVHDLKIGDELTAKDGKQIVIRDIIVKKGIAKVFNFEVEDFHTYFVGKKDVWTHNKCKDEFSKSSYQKQTANKTKLWDIKKNAIAKAETKTKNVTLYKQKDGTWWATDYDNHGGSGYKVFQEKGKEFHWIADADPYGNYIPKDSKHKSDTGKILRRK